MKRKGGHTAAHEGTHLDWRRTLERELELGFNIGIINIITIEGQVEDKKELTLVKHRLAVSARGTDSDGHF